MADGKFIFQLPESEGITDETLFVTDSETETQKSTGEQLSTYASGKILPQAQSYTDSKKTEAVDEAKQYTNTKETSIKEWAQGELSTKETSIKEWATEQFSGGGGYCPNLLINGDFQVWQRGTPIEAKSNIFFADHWRDNYVNWDFTQGTDARFSTTLKATYKNRTELPYGFKVLMIYQPLENWQWLNGKCLTLSGYIRNVGKGLGTVVNCRIGQGGGGHYAPVTPTGEWQSFTFTDKSAVFNATGKLYMTKCVMFYTGVLGDEVADGDGIELAEVKLEVGEAATPFIRRSYTEELADCQRYYQIRSANGINAKDLRPNMRIDTPTTAAATGGFSYDAEMYTDPENA